MNKIFGGFVFVHYFCKIKYYRIGSKCNEATKGGSGLNITYDLTQQSNPILKGRVNIIGIDFPCLVENEVNSINISRIQDLIKGCA